MAFFKAGLDNPIVGITSLVSGSVATRNGEQTLSVSLTQGVHTLITLSCNSGGSSPYELNVGIVNATSYTFPSSVRVLETSNSLVKVYVPTSTTVKITFYKGESGSSSFRHKLRVYEVKYKYPIKYNPSNTSNYNECLYDSKPKIVNSLITDNNISRPNSKNYSVTLNKGTYDLIPICVYTTDSAWDRTTLGTPTLKWGEITKVAGAGITALEGDIASSSYALRIRVENDNTPATITMRTNVGSSSSNKAAMKCYSLT